MAFEKEYWPDIKTGENTKSVFDFVNRLALMLEKKFEDKIECKLEEIHFKGSDFYKTISKIGQVVSGTPFSIETEPMSLEDGKRKEFHMPELREYKFVIYNKDYFYRVFDIKMSDCFPVFIRPAQDIADTFDTNNYKEIMTENELEEIIALYLKSNVVIRVLSYMLQQKPID